MLGLVTDCTSMELREGERREVESIFVFVFSQMTRASLANIRICPLTIARRMLVLYCVIMKLISQRQDIEKTTRLVERKRKWRRRYRANKESE